MKLTIGSRWLSSVCMTEVIVVKAGDDDLDLTCGGTVMISPEQERGSGEIVTTAKNGTLLGKRYVDEADTIELLCTKAGDGSLGIGETLLTEKEAKILPASD